MRIFFALFLLLAVIVSCDQVDRVVHGPKKRPVTYSFACLDSAVGGKAGNRRLEKAGDLIRDLAVSEKSITDSVQNMYGEEFHKQMIEEGEFKLVNDGALQKNLDHVLQQLLGVRSDPSAIRYSVYAIKDTMVNAFTFGGRIYITTAMLEKCKGKEGLLYAIIGHEIGHSEAGHIKATIQDIELSQKVFGENGAIVLQLKQLLTASFNQRNELEADYYGINLSNALGYDPCIAVGFWKEMAANENQYSEMEDFFRTHPFSKLRAECLSNHLRSNFNKVCE
jgi:predicted Zn-dependent protease